MAGETNVRERIRRRRLRGSMSMGSSSSSSSADDAGYGLIQEDVEEEGLEPSPDLLEEEIANFVPPSPSVLVQEEEETEGSRTRANGYGKEYRLSKVHQLMMRNLTVPEMAHALGVSESTIIRDRKELEKRLREEAQNLHIDHHIGDTLAFYKEAQGMALRAASSKKIPIHTRLAALRTALSSRNDMHKFLNVAGVYSVLQFTPTKEGANDISKLMELTTSLLEGEDNAALDVLASNMPEDEEEDLLATESF